MNLKQLQRTSYALAREKGWHEYESVTPERILAWLMLITTEVAEAAECVRRGEMTTALNENGKPVGLGSEFADIAIRLADTAEALGINLENEIRRKHAYNMTRPHRHGGKVI